MAADQYTRQYTIRSDQGGEEQTYTLRGLLEESEIEPWTNFCASIFAYKQNPPPPSYFARHYNNDPDRRLEWVRVACYSPPEQPPHETGIVVASCRVFYRTISDGHGGQLLAGGIGEVATAPDHRNRGLSKELLHDAIKIMTESNNMQVSFLHAAPSFFPVYESAGYVGTNTQWTVVDVNLNELRAFQYETSSVLVRPASFPSDTTSLMSLHQEFSEQRFVGCIIRSEAYWNDYICQELESSLWVTTRDGQLAAWLSVRPRDGRYQLREFGCASMEKSHLFALFCRLLQTAMQGSDSSSFRLATPTVVLDEIKASADGVSTYGGSSVVEWSTATDDDDLGWMYKVIGQHAISMEELTRSRPHLIWPADSF